MGRSDVGQTWHPKSLSDASFSGYKWLSFGAMRLSVTLPEKAAVSNADELPETSDLPPGPPGSGGSELDGITELLDLNTAAVPSVDPLIGKQLGGVTLVRTIAEGGMGRVYEGLQDKPKRPVAVKVMRPGFVSHDICRRFDNETEILGRLRHPYIAQIYSAGICSIVGAEVPYFVMEYVADALPITDYVKQHSLSTKQRLELFRKVCDAVAHGHAKGVIHRDLKPSNILIEPGGLPKVIDFGIARCVNVTPEQMTALTDIGQLIGTVQYMSPEQFSGDPSLIDVRSDVYALGVILYEILAGRPPYEISHKQIFEAAQVVRDKKPVPLSELSGEIDPTLDKVAGRCLRKSRDDRYANAAELAFALSPCVDGSPSSSADKPLWLRSRFIKKMKRTAGSCFPVVAALTGLAVCVISAPLLNNLTAGLRKTLEDFGTDTPAYLMVIDFILTRLVPLGFAIAPTLFLLFRGRNVPLNTSRVGLELILLVTGLAMIAVALFTVMWFGIFMIIAKDLS